MKTYDQTFLILAVLFFINFSSFAQNSRENLTSLVYSPRYFGPNAFPIPLLHNGRAFDRFEAELRWEYHHYTGDRTKNGFVRVAIPFVKGRASVEATFVFCEKYTLSEEALRERQIVDYSTRKGYSGDVVVSAMFQILKSRKWADILFNMTLKTASGDQLEQSRFTDAASYWFDINVARDLYRDESQNASVRIQAQGGFYCWMTNLLILRQNDGPSFGVGLTGTYRNFTLASDFAGFKGYKDNGDRPLILRNNLQYEYKKNILSLQYNHGMKDYLYDTWSVGYIRCF